MKEIFIGFFPIGINGEGKEQLEKNAWSIRENKNIFTNMPEIIHCGLKIDSESIEMIMKIFEIQKKQKDSIFDHAKGNPDFTEKQILKLWRKQKSNVFIAVMEEEVLWEILKIFEPRTFLLRPFNFKLLPGDSCVINRISEEKVKASFSFKLFR